MQIGKWITGPGALVVLLFFFLPWVTVSCGNMEIATLSGYQLAAGAEINTGFGTERAEGDWVVFLVFLAGLVAGGLLLAMATDLVPVQGSAVGQLIAGSIGLAVLWLKWAQLNRDVAEVGGGVSAEIGLWVTVLGLVAVIVGAAFSFFGSNNGGYEKPSYPYRSRY